MLITVKLLWNPISKVKFSTYLIYKLYFNCQIVVRLQPRAGHSARACDGCGDEQDMVLSCKELMIHVNRNKYCIQYKLLQKQTMPCLQNWEFGEENYIVIED